jgi:hypothetical protein
MWMEYAGMINEVATWDEAVSVGCDIVESSSVASWYLGDLVNKVAVIRADDPLVDKKSKTLKAFAQEIAQSYSTIKDAARVSRHVAPELRGQFMALSYGHWREIVRRGYRGGDVLEWATKAEDEGWTVTRLRYELRGESQDVLDVVRVLRGLSARMVSLTDANLRSAVEDNFEELLEARKAASSWLDRLAVLVRSEKIL